MFKTKCDVPSLGEASTKEILEIVDNALFIFVADKNGDLSPVKLALGGVNVKNLDENELPKLKVTELKKGGLKSYSNLNYSSSDDQLWQGMGDYIWVEW